MPDHSELRKTDRMERFEILTVEDTFWIDRDAVNLLILRPDFSVPKGGWKSRTETVVIRRPDGQEFAATAQIELSHFNISDPHVSIDERWRVIILLTNTTKNDVPIASKILGSQQLRDALLAGQAKNALDETAGVHLERDSLRFRAGHRKVE